MPAIWAVFASFTPMVGCPLIYLFSRDIVPLHSLKITENMCNMTWQTLKSERWIWSLLNHGKPLHNACSIKIHYAWRAVAKCDMSFEFALNVTHLSANYLNCITTTARNYTLRLHVKISWLTSELHTRSDKILGMKSPKWLNFVWWHVWILSMEFASWHNSGN